MTEKEAMKPYRRCLMSRRLLARLAAWLDPDRVVCRWVQETHEPLPGEDDTGHGYHTEGSA